MLWVFPSLSKGACVSTWDSLSRAEAGGERLPSASKALPGSQGRGGFWAADAWPGKLSHPGLHSGVLSLAAFSAGCAAGRQPDQAMVLVRTHSAISYYSASSQVSGEHLCLECLALSLARNISDWSKFTSGMRSASSD